MINSPGRGKGGFLIKSLARVPYCLIISFFFAAWALAQADSAKLIARVGTRSVTVAQFKEALLQKFQSPARVESLPPHEKEIVLNELLERVLILNEAYRKKIDSDQAVIEKVQRFRKEVMNHRLIERVVVDSILSDERLKRFYDQWGGEIRLRQIFIAAPGGVFESQVPDSTIDQPARDLAQKLYEDVRSGKDFAALAREHSQDMNSAESGGDLGYVRWGQLPKEVQDVAFTLPLETVSTPIRSGLGYHIIQVTDKKRRSFEEERETIKYQLAATYGRTIQSRRDEFLNRLAKRYRLTLHFAAIESLAARIGPHYAPFVNLTQTQNRMRLASFDGGSITVMELRKEVGGEAVNYRWDVASIERWTQRLALQAITNLEAIAQRLDVAGDVLKFKEEQMIDLLTRREVNERIHVSEKDLREYFDQHKEQFQTPSMVRVQEILLNEPYLASHVAERARRGENFEQLVQEFSLRPESRAKGGDLGWLSRAQHEEIFDAAIGRKPDDIVGPLRVVEGIIIFKVLDHRAAQVQTYEEAGTKLVSLVTEEKRRARYDRWIADLRSKTRVEVRKNAVDLLFLSTN